MLPILSARQIREADAYTIENEPIASIDLMERAARAFVKKFLELEATGKPISVFAGSGNNGGDALAIARILKKSGKRVEVYTMGNVERRSPDFQQNLERLKSFVTVNHIHTESNIPNIDHERIIIDGLFGSGLSRPVRGLFAQVIDQINTSNGHVFSIDIPSGLFADSPITKGVVIQANHTISFQLPKLTFFHPSSYGYVGEWHLVDIGLDRRFINSLKTSYFLTQEEDIKLPGRKKYDHKGNAGRMLLISGSKGKVGATILAARAAMRSGTGLLFIHSPNCATVVLQTSVPEAMVIEDEHMEVITEIDLSGHYDTIAIGPGIGTNELTAKAVEKLILNSKAPLVLDADALNILSQNSGLIDALPKESILTPHPGEFKRLVGEWSDDFQKLELLRSFCKQYKVNAVLKGPHSAVCDSSGTVFFNSTGNSGMATGGSGDVLAGIAGAFVGQAIDPFQAIKSAVYIHGLAGDQALREKGEISLIASDIIEKVPSAIRNVQKV